MTLNPKFQGAAVTNPATIGGVGAAVAISVLGGGTVQKWVKLTPQVWDMKTGGEDDQVELLAEAAADVQLAAVHQAVDDVHRCQLVGCKGP